MEKYDEIGAVVQQARSLYAVYYSHLIYYFIYSFHFVTRFARIFPSFCPLIRFHNKFLRSLQVA